MTDLTAGLHAFPQTKGLPKAVGAWRHYAKEVHGMALEWAGSTRALIPRPEVTKVQHYWLEVDSAARPLGVREPAARSGDSL